MYLEKKKKANSLLIFMSLMLHFRAKACKALGRLIVQWPNSYSHLWKTE